MQIFFKNTFSFLLISVGLISLLNSGCKNKKVEPEKLIIKNTIKSINDSIIIDCNYSYEQAIAGTKAPKNIINQLRLINVKYYSIDGKIHAGQILTNKIIAKEIKDAFEFILRVKFPVASVIPIVKYKWNDDLSMQANNTYSFCYRNVSYSKHATGMAIDINPYFNPVRWKEAYKHRIDKPVGAIYDPSVKGTFYPMHPVVKKFNDLGFFWGRNFKRNYDDHHFEK